jgi:hypothetical protein
MPKKAENPENPKNLYLFDIDETLLTALLPFNKKQMISFVKEFSKDIDTNFKKIDVNNRKEIKKKLISFYNDDNTELQETGFKKDNFLKLYKNLIDNICKEICYEDVIAKLGEANEKTSENPYHNILIGKNSTTRRKDVNFDYDIDASECYTLYKEHMKNIMQAIQLAGDEIGFITSSWLAYDDMKTFFKNEYDINLDDISEQKDFKQKRMKKGYSYLEIKQTTTSNVVFIDNKKSHIDEVFTAIQTLRLSKNEKINDYTIHAHTDDKNPDPSSYIRELYQQVLKRLNDKLKESLSKEKRKTIADTQLKCLNDWYELLEQKSEIEKDYEAVNLHKNFIHYEKKWEDATSLDAYNNKKIVQLQNEFVSRIKHANSSSLTEEDIEWLANAILLLEKRKTRGYYNDLKKCIISTLESLQDTPELQAHVLDRALKHLNKKLKKTDLTDDEKSKTLAEKIQILDETKNNKTEINKTLDDYLNPTDDLAKKTNKLLEHLKDTPELQLNVINQAILAFENKGSQQEESDNQTEKKLLALKLKILLDQKNDENTPKVTKIINASLKNYLLQGDDLAKNTKELLEHLKGAPQLQRKVLDYVFDHLNKKLEDTNLPQDEKSQTLAKKLQLLHNQKNDNNKVRVKKIINASLNHYFKDQGDIDSKVENLNELLGDNKELNNMVSEAATKAKAKAKAKTEKAAVMIQKHARGFFLRLDDTKKKGSKTTKHGESESPDTVITTR